MRLGAGATGTPVLLQAPSTSPPCHVQTASLRLWGEMMTGVPGGVLVGGRGLPLPWLPAHDAWLAGLDDPTAAEEGGSLTEKASAHPLGFGKKTERVKWIYSSLGGGDGCS